MPCLLYTSKSRILRECDGYPWNNYSPVQHGRCGIRLQAHYRASDPEASKQQDVYKRQPSTPLTFIFGAKAAPAYVIAQDIIHLLLVMSDIINNDPEVSPYMKRCV